MLLEEKKLNDDHIEKFEYDGNYDLKRAADLLYEILNDSYKCSRSCLEFEKNGQRYNIQKLYSDCKRNLETVLKGGSKTEFLSMCVLEDTFKQALPLLLVRVEELVDGNLKSIEQVKELQGIFADNPFTKIWKEKANLYRENLKTMGLDLVHADYMDLTAIMEPMLNAFTIYEGGKYRGAPKIYQVREGKRSNKRPRLMLNVCKFDSVKLFVDAVSSCEEESMVAFCGVEVTNRAMDDGFYTWYNGKAPERESNYIRNFHMTRDEYLNSIFSRTLYLCVKSGEAVYFMEMPFLSDMYIDMENPKSMFYYGERASYAPYSVFYKDLGAKPVETTFPAVKKTGYHLSELMDDAQKIWLPIFLEETYERFYKTLPNAKKVYLPEEIAAVVKAGRRSDASEDKMIIPVITELPSIRTFIHTVRNPEECFEGEEEILYLLRKFNITPRDLFDTPILPSGFLTEDALKQHISKREKNAYVKVLAVRIAEFLENRWNVRKTVIREICSQGEKIQNAFFEGRFDSFSEVIIDGNEIMVTTDGGKRKKIIQETKWDDCKDNSGWSLEWMIRPVIMWAGEKTVSKAPVVVKIRPKTSEDFKVLFDVCGQTLPEYLEEADHIKGFIKSYEHEVPYCLKELYQAQYYDETRVGKLTIQYPDISDINLCMSKKTYKKFAK